MLATVNHLEFLRGISRYFGSREAADGSIVCPRHKIEHTGKVIHAASVDLRLLKEDADEALGQRIRRRVLRAVSMVGSDPNSNRPVFLPGSTDHRNVSSNLIDSGACCDVLSEVLEGAPELFSGEEREQIVAAVDNVCDGYLREAVIEREVPSQRLWGAVGLARAARALDRPRYGEKAREAVRKVVADAHPDGSIPYMPDPEAHGEHVGLEDITSYYHARHLVFVAYIYQCLEEVFEEEVAQFLTRGVRFLCALYGRDGFKPLANEAKQWYWESPYEVASHPFDLYALLEAGGLWDSRQAMFTAALSWRRLQEHVDPKDGGLQSHLGEEINFQCRDIWTGNAAWIGRIERGQAQLPDLSGQMEEPEPCGVELFDESGLVRVERQDYVAILRGRKQPINISFGAEAGGGSLIYFGRRDAEFRDQVRIPKWTSLAPGNFVATPRDRPSFKQRVMSFYRDNRHDMRFRLYVANLERKAGNTKKALEYPLRHVVNKLRDEMKGRYASHFDCSPSLSRNANELVYSSMLSRRDGAVMRGSAMTRRYLCGELDLEVEDALNLDQPVRAVLYQQVDGVREFKVESSSPYKQNGTTLIFQPESYPSRITVRYRL